MISHDLVVESAPWLNVEHLCSSDHKMNATGTERLRREDFLWWNNIYPPNKPDPKVIVYGAVHILRTTVMRGEGGSVLNGKLRVKFPFFSSISLSSSTLTGVPSYIKPSQSFTMLTNESDRGGNQRTFSQIASRSFHNNVGGWIRSASLLLPLLQPPTSVQIWPSRLFRQVFGTF